MSGYQDVRSMIMQEEGDGFTQEGQNIYSLFQAAASQAGSRPMLVESGVVRLRYDEMDSRAGRMAQKLRDAGASPGDRIVVQVDKSIAAVVLYLAALRAGIVFVPLNTAYTKNEVAYFLEDSEPAILVCDPKRRAELEGLANAAGVRSVLVLDADQGESDLRGGSSCPVEPRGKDDLASILYTSGTTGRSKGAMLSHDNLASNALALKHLWRWEEGDVLLHALPIFHVHGLFVALHGALLNGSTILFHRRFDAEAVVKDLPRATVFMGIPTFYTRLLDNPGLTRDACSGMRLFTSGSAPLLEETFARFRDRTGREILERYGMTETGMITSNPYEGPRLPGTVGFALPGVRVRVSNAEGVPVPQGTPGVLEVNGPNVFRGYWKLPEKTAEEFRPDGYFITGDIATESADGRVRLIGRARDLIISGGLNVYPKEIELLIDAIEGIGESAVIGVPHSDLGEAVVAVATRAQDSIVSEAAVMNALNGRLARFKQPKRIILVDQLPRNAMGKVQKAALRAEYRSLLS